MSRPLLEMADIVRCAGQTFVERSRNWITWQHQKVLLAITRCRTAALGGHRDRCTGCGQTTAISYNSCRNRHCPKCQGNARHRWLEARQRQLLPTRYVHVVFTLPRELAPIALQNKRAIYNLLFHSSAATLLEVARDPRHLGAEIGFFSVLHTWDQRLQHHPHVHCVVPAGGLWLDHTHWIHTRYSFFLPIKVLSRVFRGKFVAALKRACSEGKLRFYGDLNQLAQPKIFSACSANFSAMTGWSIANRPSLVPSMPYAISALTPTASLSPITGSSSPWPMAKSRFAGGIRPTKTKSA